MDAVSSYIDILSKLIIAFIGLIAPITSFLLTNYSERIVKIKSMFAEKKDTIERDHINEVTSGANISNLAKKSTKKLKENEKEEQRHLSHLEPKKNIIFFFLFLFSSIIVLVIDIFVRKNYLGLYNHCISIILISLSTILFGIAVWRIYKVICAFIDTKKIIDDYYNSVSLGQ